MVFLTDLKPKNYMVFRRLPIFRLFFSRFKSLKFHDLRVWGGMKVILASNDDLLRITFLQWIRRWCYEVDKKNLSLGVMFANPCWGKACHNFASCKVVNVGEAVCVCPQNCSRVRKPVCGINWKSYDNLCSLMAESCEMNNWNSMRYNGECKFSGCW